MSVSPHPQLGLAPAATTDQQQQAPPGIVAAVPAPGTATQQTPTVVATPAQRVLPVVAYIGAHPGASATTPVVVTPTTQLIPAERSVQSIQLAPTPASAPAQTTVGPTPAPGQLVLPFGVNQKRTIAYLSVFKGNATGANQTAMGAPLANASGSGTTSEQEGTATILVPLAVTPVATTGTNHMINFKISNGQIQQEGSGGAVAMDTDKRAKVGATERRMSTAELDRCLQEAVAAIFAPDDAPTPPTPPAVEEKTEVKPEVKLQEPEAKLEPPELKPAKESQAMDSNTKKQASEPQLPRDIKPKLPDMGNFDPMKALDWKDGIGSLPGSNLKFRVNDLGLMEVVDEEETPVSDPKKESKSLLLGLGLKQKEGDTPAVKEEPKEEPTPSVKEDPAPAPKASSRTASKAIKTRTVVGASDDIYCCEGCGCYGLSSEFVNRHFCSHSCVTAYATKKAAMLKKEAPKKTKRAVKKPVATTPEEMTPVPSEDESEAPAAKLPWQLGKTGFAWMKYLDHSKSVAAPIKLFKDAFPYARNGFKVGMKLEGIDPEHQSLFCVLTVAEVQGYRLRLHFDGYPFCHDFWVNADSPDIFPMGWCEHRGYQLQSPKGYMEPVFNWASYLKQCRAQPAPKHLFTNRGPPVCPTGFRTGMKLEAVDRKNSSLVCVATVAQVMEGRILVHFDSWDDLYDYWADVTSPHIHPVGWCTQNNRELTPPNGWGGGEDGEDGVGGQGKVSPQKDFCWEEYLKATQTVAAPSRAFKPRAAIPFRPGLKLEIVDPRNPVLIRVATVIEVGEFRVKIHFDGWPDQFDFWTDDDHPDLHPVGWCRKTSHVLEPPPTDEEMSGSSPAVTGCPTPGCKGIGHVKGAKFTTHHSSQGCPYAPHNLDKEGLIPDRIEGRILDQEPEELLLNPDPEPPRKRRKRGGIKGEEMTPPPLPPPAYNPSVQDEQKLRRDVHNSVFCPGYHPDPEKARKGQMPWTRHSKTMSLVIESLRGPQVLRWNPEQVADFIKGIPGCEKSATLFKEEVIDGEALLLMNQNDMVKILGVKLGPAIKIFNCITILRHRP